MIWTPRTSQCCSHLHRWLGLWGHRMLWLRRYTHTTHRSTGRTGSTLHRFLHYQPACCPSRCALMMGSMDNGLASMECPAVFHSRGPPHPCQVHGREWICHRSDWKWDIGSKAQGPLKLDLPRSHKHRPRKKDRNISAKTRRERPSGSPIMTEIISSNLSSDINQSPSFFTGPLKPFIQKRRSPSSLTERTTAKGKAANLLGPSSRLTTKLKLTKVLSKHGLRKNTLVISPGQRSQCRRRRIISSLPGGKGAAHNRRAGYACLRFFHARYHSSGKDYHKQIANFDFYSTIASVAGLPIPKHCDGVDLIPYINARKRKNLTSIFSGSTTNLGCWKKTSHCCSLEEMETLQKVRQGWLAIIRSGADPEEENNLAKNTHKLWVNYPRSMRLGSNPRPLGQDPKAFQVRRSYWNGPRLGLLTKIGFTI